MKKTRFLALMLAMLLVLAGCGGAATSQSSAPAQQAPAASESGATEQPATDGLQKPDNFPRKEITLIIPFAAGGAFDVMARTLQPVIKEMYDIDVMVKCVAGGGSAVGIMEALTSDPDGYTIAFGSTSYLGLIAQGLMDASVDDADFLCSISADPMVLLTSADGPYTNVEDYIAAALANPGTVSLGNPGTNNTNQAHSVFLDIAVGEGTFQMISYADGDARVITELLGGHCDAGILKPNSAMSQIMSGELVMTAVFAEERLEAFPDVPTFKELGYDTFPYGDVAQTVCFALAPKGLDPEIKEYLTQVLYGATQSDTFQALAAEGAFAAPGIHGEELEAYVRELYAGAEVLAEKVFTL